MLLESSSSIGDAAAASKPAVASVPMSATSTSSASDNESVTLVNEAPTLASDIEGDAPATVDGKDSTAAPKDIIKVLADKPGYHKELRTNAKGRRYLVETEGLWTTVRSLDPRRSKRKPVLERLAKRFKDFRTFWPFLWRFAQEVIALGKYRFLFHLISSTISGLAPALRMYLSARLISIAQAASEKRILHKKELFTVAATSYLSSYAETWIYNLQSSNTGVMSRRFEDMVQQHLMEARTRLDMATLNKPRVVKDFASAGTLVHALGDGSFVVNQVIDLFTSAMSLIAQAKVLWNMTSRDNADLAMVSAFSSSLLLIRWLIMRFRMSVMAITDPNYNRMNIMSHMSHPDPASFGERKVLGLGSWVLQEFRKASKALGDVSLAAPSQRDPFGAATDAVRSFTDTAIYVLFALKVADRPLEESALSMSSLAFIQSAARGLAGSIYYFVRELKSFGNEFEAFRAYYRISEIKSMLADPPKPRPYETVKRILPDGAERQGMEIEFRDVVFRWPGKKENALDGISFVIKAGELCAVCGYNGAGKSTLIALMARLCDPISGEILINGHSIKSYSLADLHKYMSLLFQSSADLPLTLREFIGIGDLDQVGNMDKIRQAATDSGAIEFIDKLEKGFESAFESGGPIMENVDTLYRDIQEWEGDSDDEDEYDKKEGDEDDDECSSGESEDEQDDEGEKAKEKKDKKGDTPTDQEKQKSEEDDDIDTTGGRLAFSGGQRQKLNLARSFMRTSADLAIFDEYSANLDPVAEHDLYKRITVNRGKQTLVYITHRYSTVKNADRILMLEKGKVVESGTHDELMKIPSGKYAEMSRLALGGDSDARVDDNERTAINTPLPASRPGSPTAC